MINAEEWCNIFHTKYEYIPLTKKQLISKIEIFSTSDVPAENRQAAINGLLMYYASVNSSVDALINFNAIYEGEKLNID